MYLEQGRIATKVGEVCYCTHVQEGYTADHSNYRGLPVTIFIQNFIEYPLKGSFICEIVGDEECI
jgi:hypothetical protein